MQNEGIIVGDTLVTWDTVRAAQRRLYVHDDPCAEYEISDGVVLCAADIVAAAEVRS